MDPVSPEQSWRLHKEIGVKRSTPHGEFVDGSSIKLDGPPHIVRYLPADAETPNLHVYFVTRFEGGKESPIFKQTINTNPKVKGARTIYYPRGFRRHAETIANHARDKLGLELKVSLQREIRLKEHAISIAEDV